jgi:outer membrane protein OmpA-like peptidoglycan-associated protein
VSRLLGFGGALVLAGTVVLAPTGPAAASLADLPAPTEQELRSSISDLDPDVSDLDPAVDELDRSVTGADTTEDAVVAVHGHTDSKGEDVCNQQLSEDRARAVAEVISAARSDLELEIEGFGETRPVASNGTSDADDPEGRAKNRRVEIRCDS